MTEGVLIRCRVPCRTSVLCHDMLHVPSVRAADDEMLQGHAPLHRRIPTEFPPSASDTYQQFKHHRTDGNIIRAGLSGTRRLSAVGMARDNDTVRPYKVGVVIRKADTSGRPSESGTRTASRSLMPSLILITPSPTTDRRLRQRVWPEKPVEVGLLWGKSQRGQGGLSRSLHRVSGRTNGAGRPE